MNRSFFPVAALLAGTTVAHADAHAGGAAPFALPYEVFEITTPHLDMAECPDDLAGEDRFCRAAAAHDQIYVFAFSLDGDSPLVGMQAYPGDGLEALLK